MRTALCGTIVLLLLGSCSNKNDDLSLAVSIQEPAPEIAKIMSGVLAANDISVEVVSIPDTAEIVEKIRSREIDLAIIEEPDQPLRGLTTLLPLYPGVLHVLHNRTDAEAGFVELIRGASIYPGPSGSAGHRLLLQLAADFNIGDDEYQLLDDPWTQVPDIHFIFGGLLSDEAVANLGDYRLFSFGDAADLAGGSVADGIVLKHHQLTPFLLPKGVYHTLADEAVLTLSIRSVLVAHQSFDEELAYDIALALFNQSQELGMSYPLVTRELNENVRFNEMMMPLHVGTRRYLNRDGPGFVERYVDVLALYFTLIITVLSGGVALYRHRLQVRKDRVDVFYTRLLEIRNKMKVSRTESAFTDCYNDVLDVQREVLDLLVDERIAADASLVAFVSLSNQMINELQRRLDG